MAKLVPLEEAARFLGITPDQLVEMRSRNDIAGYRDGSSWKFKQSELDRVKESLQGGSISLDPASEEDDEALDLGELDLTQEPSDNDSILVSEEQLGESDRSTSSTVIGKEDHVLTEEESDLQLVGDDDLDLEAPGPGVTVADTQPPSSDAELRLADDEHLGGVEDSGPDVMAASHPAEEGESELELQFDDEDAVEMAEADDDAMVLDDAGSDVTLSSGDSGINLASPSDSGISLEDLGDDLALDEPLVEVSDEEGVEVGDVRGDDDFLLTPDEEAVAEEDEESGSQVIALDEEEFIEADAGLEAGPDFLEEEPLGVGAVATPQAGVARGAAEDTEFTGANVLTLGVLALLMIFSALVVADVIVNMWSWSGGSFSSILVDALVSPFSG